MKKLVILSLLCSTVASAQVIPSYNYPSAGTPPVVQLQCSDTYTNCLPVSSSNPLKVSGGGTSSNPSVVIGDVAAGVADNGSAPVKTGAVAADGVQAAQTVGNRSTMTTDLYGNLRTVLSAVGQSLTALDNVGAGNVVVPYSRTTPGQGNGPQAVVNYVYNGTNTYAMRGDSNGSFVQGSTASGSADAGNPMKVGGLVTTTTPTSRTTGQRTDAWFGNAGQLMASLMTGSSADGTLSTVAGSGIDQAGNIRFPGFVAQVWNGSNYNYQRGNADGTAVLMGATAAQTYSATITTVAATATNSLKAAAGNLYGVNVIASSTAGFVCVANAATMPADGAVSETLVLYAMPLAANAGIHDQFTVPLSYNLGIQEYFSSTYCTTKTSSAPVKLAGQWK